MNTIKTENKIEIKPGYKKTPVGMIPEDWEVKKLKNISQIVGGFAFKSRDFVDYGKYQVVKMSNVYQGVLDLERSKSFLNKLTDREKEYLLIQGDILISLTGTVGKKDYGYTILINEEDNLLLNQRLAKIVVNKTTNCSYLFYCLKTSSFLRQFFNSSRGGTGNQANVSVVDLGKTNLPIPPLPEQKAIADCLSTWDKGIEKLSALIASKKEQKKGLMQGLFSGKLKVENGELVKVEDEKLWLKGWKEVRLEKYFKERNQRGFKDLDLLSIGEEGVYPQSDSNKKDTSNSDKSKYKLIEIGDLGYNTMRLWQGRIALSNIRGIVSPAYTILIPKIGKVNSNYFSYLFKMPFVVNKFYRNSQGMVSDTLTCRYNDFKKIKLFIPSIEEQAAIAEVLITADKEIELLEKQLTQLELQKKGLMQVLLTGEKRLV